MSASRGFRFSVIRAKAVVVSVILLASLSSLVAVAAPAEAAGTGTGLRANYWNDTNFTTHKCSRTDATVNFDWGYSPPCGMVADYFSARWTGMIQPLYTQTYTFYANADDGVRLYVNGKKLIDRWYDNFPSETAATITLTAGTKYRIQLDYYNGPWTSMVKLLWSSASQPKQIVPTTQLYADDTACGAPTTISQFKTGSIGTIWNAATQRTAYGRPGAGDSYDAYTADAYGNNERRITAPAGTWREDRHQWPEEWHPSGNYLFMYVEKSEYVAETTGHTRAPVDATPGYGGYTDMWIVKSDGSMAWPLVVTPNNYNGGIIHAAISADGKKFAWSERIGAPSGLGIVAAGSTVMRIADFVDGPNPQLTNIKTFQPGGVPSSNELDGISPDNKNIAFYSTFETGSLFNTPIYTINVSTGVITRLTDSSSFYQAPTYTPDGKSIVYMTGVEADIFPWEIQGADWWIMNTDGSNKRRLTFMNKWNHPQSINRYRLAGSISFIDNTSFYGGVMTAPVGNLVGDTVKVTCD